jgi:CRISPR-associated protein Cmr3
LVWYFIEACDVLMFRDGRPFTAGESHLIQSRFPPTPLTLQGALRTFFLTSNGYHVGGKHPRNYQSPVGFGDELGQFEMHGPYLARRIRDRQSERIVQYLPLPADLSYTKEKVTVLRSPKPAAGGIANFPTGANAQPMIDTRQLADFPDEGWLPAPVFNQYLQNRNAPSSRQIQYTRDLFYDEPRFGVGLEERSRRPLESMLYRAAFKRLALDVGLLVWVNLPLALPQNGEAVIPLGGENHAARLHKYDDSQVEVVAAMNQPSKRSNRWKITLLTPAYFSNNGVDTWQPADWSRFFPGASVSVVSAAMPRPQVIGGWDLVKPGPRPVIRIVPAGSVYWFESSAPPNQALTDQPVEGFPSLKRLGFGRFAVSE